MWISADWVPINRWEAEMDSDNEVMGDLSVSTFSSTSRRQLTCRI